MKGTKENGETYYYGFCYDILEDFAKAFNFRYFVIFLHTKSIIDKSLTWTSTQYIISTFVFLIFARYESVDGDKGLFGNPTEDELNATGMVGMVMRGVWCFIVFLDNNLNRHKKREFILLICVSFKNLGGEHVHFCLYSNNRSVFN